jgi:hypothetical protein
MVLQQYKLKGLHIRHKISYKHRPDDVRSSRVQCYYFSCPFYLSCGYFEQFICRPDRVTGRTSSSPAASSFLIKFQHQIRETCRIDGSEIKSKSRGIEYLMV